MSRAALAIAVIAVVAGGCRTETLQEAGVVIAVDQASLSDVRGFTLRTKTGETLTFEVGAVSLAGGGFPANHLREHMATVSPVLVDYTDQDGQRIAIRLTDAPSE